MVTTIIVCDICEKIIRDSNADPENYHVNFDGLCFASLCIVTDTAITKQKEKILTICPECKEAIEQFIETRKSKNICDGCFGAANGDCGRCDRYTGVEIIAKDKVVLRRN